MLAAVKFGLTPSTAAANRDAAGPGAQNPDSQSRPLPRNVRLRDDGNRPETMSRLNDWLQTRRWPGTTRVSVTGNASTCRMVIMWSSRTSLSRSFRHPPRRSAAAALTSPIRSGIHRRDPAGKRLAHHARVTPTVLHDEDLSRPSTWQAP